MIEPQMTSTQQVYSPTKVAVACLYQLLMAIQREIDADPPFSKANAERRGELDQLRDMIDRRT